MASRRLRDLPVLVLLGIKCALILLEQRHFFLSTKPANYPSQLERQQHVFSTQIRSAMGKKNVSVRLGGIDSNEINPFVASAANISQIILFSLTILLTVVYTILIIVRPTFRRNKLNWFTVNITLQTTLFSTLMFSLSIEQSSNDSKGLPCRIQEYLLNMAVCQVLYSH